MPVCSITGQKRREHVCKQQVGLSIWKAIRASVVCLEGQSSETDTSAREKTAEMLSFIFVFAHLQRHFSCSYLCSDSERLSSIQQGSAFILGHLLGLASAFSSFLSFFLKLNFFIFFNIIFLFFMWGFYTMHPNHTLLPIPRRSTLLPLCLPHQKYTSSAICVAHILTEAWSSSHHPAP